MQVEVPPDRPRVEVALPSGEAVLLVPIAHDDRHYLEQGLAELSPESRYTRFGQGLESLSNAELEYLTNVGAIADKDAFFLFAPVRIKGTAGGYGRAIALW